MPSLRERDRPAPAGTTGPMTFRPLETLEDVPSQLGSMHVPGLSLAYLCDGEIVTRAWGERISTDTMFAAASITKPVVAYAALELASRGRLDLDADVNTILTSWKVPAIDGWQPLVTTRMLLAHVAGFGDTGGQDVADPPMWGLPNLFATYSGAGYALAARVVHEAMGGDEIDDVMRELVLGPLGMSSTTFGDPPAERACEGHADGTPVPFERRRWETHMWTTPSDLIRFAQAVNAGAHPEMLTGHHVEPRMGLGLFLTAHDGIDWWSHGGSTPGFESMLCGCAPSSFAAVAMTNASQGTLCALDVLRVISTEHGPGPIHLDHISTDGRMAWARMTEINKQAAGRYLLPSGAEVLLGLAPKVWGQDEIVLTLPGQPPMELERVIDAMWRVPRFQSYVVYEPPDAIRFLQGGREVRATRREGGT